MSTLTLSHEAGIVSQAAHRISTAPDYDRLIELAGEAQFVLIGEASHGTHDFYVTRAEPDAPAHRGERLSHRRLGGGLAGHVAGASLRHWPRQRARRGGGAWGFSPISRVDVAQHSDGRIRQLVARLESSSGPRKCPRRDFRDGPLQHARLNGIGAWLSRQSGSRSGPPRAPPLQLL